VPGLRHDKIGGLIAHTGVGLSLGDNPNDKALCFDDSRGKNQFERYPYGYCLSDNSTVIASQGWASHVLTPLIILLNICPLVYHKKMPCQGEI